MLLLLLLLLLFLYAAVACRVLPLLLSFLRIRRWYHEAQQPPLQLRCLQQQQQQVSIDATGGPQAGAPGVLAARLQLDPKGAPWPLPLMLSDNTIDSYSVI